MSDWQLELDAVKNRVINLLAALLLCVGLGACGRDPSPNLPVSSPRTLAALLKSSPAELAAVDIAHLNLLCAQGLAGAECMNLEFACTQLDIWTERVRSETDRHQYRFDS